MPDTIADITTLFRPPTQPQTGNDLKAAYKTLIAAYVRTHTQPPQPLPEPQDK